MNEQKFFYVSYIKTTLEELWTALTSADFTRQYWGGINVESDWKIGSSVKLSRDGMLIIAGKVIASEKPRVLSYTWTVEFDPEQRVEKPSQVTFLLEQFEPTSEIVKLTVTHESFPEKSKVFVGISDGWPRVLSGLKSLLETGKAMPFEGTCGKHK